MTDLKLLAPLTTEAFEFKNRVFMAPMTRAQWQALGQDTTGQFLAF